MPITLPLITCALPLLVFFILLLFGKSLRRGGDWLAILAMTVSCVVAVFIFYQTWPEEVYQWEFTWFSVGNYPFTAGMLLDKLSAFMLVLVTFISLLVQVYSTRYMQGDKCYSAYFAYLGLFTAAMLGIVLAKNLLILYVAWELVGVSSYLLIGFWRERPDASRASRNAFLINRIGDTGFLIGILILFMQLGTFDIPTITSANLFAEPSSWLILAGLGIFCGCVAKSAQFPLQIWLPGAMAGPTPVSALIHAATMVAAGVFLLARLYAIFTPEVLTVIAVVGAITAFMGAFAALLQTDIKRLLAFSTISQLGYMVMGMGVGAYSAALFHLLTHAFFKAGLFLSAGAIIHALHRVEHHYHVSFNPQDMRLMGGLRRQMPFTFICYTVCALSLAGLPLFSGFLSKDAILSGALSWAADQPVFWAYAVADLGFLSAFLTAMYVGRQLILVFFGEFRLERMNAAFAGALQTVREVPGAMLGPMALLAVLSLFFFFSLNPFDAEHGWFIPVMALEQSASGNHLFTALTAGFLAFAGLGIAYALTGRSRMQLPQWVRNLSLNNWYLDDIYRFLFVRPGTWIMRFTRLLDARLIDTIIDYTAMGSVVLAHIIAWMDRTIVDGTVRLLTYAASRIGLLARSAQTGKVQWYLASALAGLLLLIVWIIL